MTVFFILLKNGRICIFKKVPNWIYLQVYLHFRMAEVIEIMLKELKSKLQGYVFKLTAPKNEWLKFLQQTPQPGSHDIIAMLRRKVLKFEGDLHPLMSHLLYFKLLLASLRPVENKNEN